MEKEKSTRNRRLLWVALTLAIVIPFAFLGLALFLRRKRKKRLLEHQPTKSEELTSPKQIPQEVQTVDTPSVTTNEEQEFAQAVNSIRETGVYPTISQPTVQYAPQAFSAGLIPKFLLSTGRHNLRLYFRDRVVNIIDLNLSPLEEGLTRLTDAHGFISVKAYAASCADDTAHLPLDPGQPLPDAFHTDGTLKHSQYASNIKPQSYITSCHAFYRIKRLPYGNREGLIPAVSALFRGRNHVPYSNFVTTVAPFIKDLAATLILIPLHHRILSTLAIPMSDDAFNKACIKVTNDITPDVLYSDGFTSGVRVNTPRRGINLAAITPLDRFPGAGNMTSNTAESYKLIHTENFLQKLRLTRITSQSILSMSNEGYHSMLKEQIKEHLSNPNYVFGFIKWICDSFNIDTQISQDTSFIVCFNGDIKPSIISSNWGKSKCVILNIHGDIPSYMALWHARNGSNVSNYLPEQSDLQDVIRQLYGTIGDTGDLTKGTVGLHQAKALIYTLTEDSFSTLGNLADSIDCALVGKTTNDPQRKGLITSLFLTKK